MKLNYKAGNNFIECERHEKKKKKQLEMQKWFDCGQFFFVH